MIVLFASAAPQVHSEEHLTSFSIDLDDDEVKYLSIVKTDLADEHHYVELGDQGMGRYNGVLRFEVSEDARNIALTLAFNVAGRTMSQDFVVKSKDPMDPVATAWARMFAVEIEARQ